MDYAAHHALLEAGVVIVEGLDLSAVEPGEYEMTCLPLRIVGADGSPREWCSERGCEPAPRPRRACGARGLTAGPEESQA